MMYIETLNRTAADQVRDLCASLGMYLHHVEVNEVTVRWFYDCSEEWKRKTINSMLKEKYWFIEVKES